MHGLATALKIRDELVRDVKAAILESDAEGMFDMNYWAHPCGKPACIGGWVVHLSGIRSGHHVYDTAVAFGIDMGQADRLTGGEWGLETLGAKDACIAIDKAIAGKL